MQATNPSPASGGDLRAILAPIAEDMNAVDSLIRARLSSDVVLINTIADYIIGAGGKRMRPAIVLMIARALGYKGDHHVLLAAVIEFIHTATLLHDDVVDESDLRRGRSTANAAFGNAASVLVGDFLYSRSFQMMVETDNLRVMRILADATNRISEGEVLQLLNIHDPSVDEERYFGVIERKTATLFEAGARIGAVIAGADAATEDACGHYAACLGRAFQIVDDILDYSGKTEDIGKQLGDDLREGKVTLPVIHALRTAPEQDRQFIIDAIRSGDGDFGRITDIVIKSGALEYSRELALRELEAGTAAAKTLPQSEFQNSLIELLSFAVARDR